MWRGTDCFAGGDDVGVDTIVVKTCGNGKLEQAAIYCGGSATVTTGDRGVGIHNYIYHIIMCMF